MILQLAEILRTRVARQLGKDYDSSTSIKTLTTALDRAFWIYGNYGLTSRIGNVIRSATRRLDKETTVKMPIGNAYRIMNKITVAKIYKGFRSTISDDELLDAIPDGGIGREKLSKALEMSVRKLNYRIRKEQNNWQVVKHQDKVYKIEDFLDDQQEYDLKDVILEVLDRFPYCNVEQLELLTNCSRTQLASPIALLADQDKIIRGITRVEAPDEMFALPHQELLDESEELPVIVLEKRDALVEMIKLERYFQHQDAYYWIFIDGVPQAEFDLDKNDSYRSLTVANLNRFNLTNYELGDILTQIKTWGKSQEMEILIDTVNDPTTTTIKTLTQLLRDRGYQLVNDKLVLDKFQQNVVVADPRKISEDETTEVPDILNWKVIGPWAKNRQFLNYDGSIADVVYHLGQLDDPRSIAYRLQTNPERLRYDDVVYIPGINHRLGFVHKEMVEDIIRGWPNQARYNFIDKKILGVLQEPKMTEEIITEIGEGAMTVKQRLRYLEQSRSIRKFLPGSLHIDECIWTLFDEGLKEYSKPVGGKRAMASVGTFFMKALESNPPLTKNQLSRFLGMTVKELDPLIKQYLRISKILEGYFVAGVSDIQYTLQDVLDTLRPTDQDYEMESAVNRVDILPLSDPYALIHLPPLVLKDSSIQPTERYDELAEQWMIIWDGQPVGYMIKQPTTQMLLDYELDMKITKDMITTPIIAGALQKIVSLFRTWYGDEGKIKTINGIEASDNKWQNIHFMIESIGVEMD